MILFPLAAAAVAAAFGGRLARDYARRGRLPAGLWAIALFMYAGASAALALGVLDRWSPSEYRVYWTLGAILNVPYLAMGELYLLLPDRRAAWGHVLLVALLAGTALAVGTVRTADLDAAALGADLPLGKDVFGDGSAPHRFAQLFVYPAYFFLVGGAVWSALRMRGEAALRNRFYGTLLIAAGATIVAIGTGVGAGLLESFVVVSVSLAGGIAVMFAGFLRSARAVAPRPG